MDITSCIYLIIVVIKGKQMKQKYILYIIVMMLLTLSDNIMVLNVSYA